jgi:penicillin amidase
VKTVLERARSWCDDRTTEKIETCDEQVSASLADAIASLSGRHGSDLTRWQWGDEHVVRFDHPVLGRVPFIGPLFNVRLPADGGPYTLNRGQIRASTGDAPYASVHGAAYRAAYDLANLKQSRFVVTPGQSGNWFSPHYDDLAVMWRDGGTLPASGIPSESQPLLNLRPRQKR